ncbi:MAG TPA: hypothetical protein VGJ25_10000 [Gaiellaceae bacterium]|jgi:hypothetical protein
MPEELVGGLLAERLTEEFLLVTTGDDPAASAEVLVTVPGRARWELYSFVVQLVTDATITARNVKLVADDQSTVYARMPTFRDHAASTTVNYSWFRGAVGGNSSAAPVDVEAPLPPLVLMPGHRLLTVTVALAPTDNYGRPVLLVRELAERGPVAELAWQMEQLAERFRALEEIIPGAVPA